MFGGYKHHRLFLRLHHVSQQMQQKRCFIIQPQVEKWKLEERGGGGLVNGILKWFYLKVYTFIHPGSIKLMKSNSKDMYNAAKDFYLFEAVIIFHYLCLNKCSLGEQKRLYFKNIK